MLLLDMNLSRLALVTLALLTVPAPGAANGKQDCLNGLRAMLTSGGFSGSIDCSRDRLTVRQVGTLGPAGHVVTVYDYRYRLAPICAECAVHGGQRILFFKRNRYIGQYKPDPLRLAVHHDRLVLIPEPWSGINRHPAVSVKVTREGPPREVLVDGDLLELFR